MLLIDKYAYLNKLASVHPLEKMIFSLGLLLITLILRDERLSLITFFVMSAFIILGAKFRLHTMPSYYCYLVFSYSQVSYLFYFPLHRQPMHYLPIFGLIHGRIGLFSLGTQVCY